MNKCRSAIWIDSREAIIITFSKHKERLIRVESEVEDFHVRGGARADTPYGTQLAVSEQHYLKRKQHQFKLFFYKVLEHLTETDELVIYGPGEVRKAFQETILKLHQRHYQVVGCFAMDKMTDNQIKAAARNFFGIPHSNSKLKRK